MAHDCMECGEDCDCGNDEDCELCETCNDPVDPAEIDDDMDDD